MGRILAWSCRREDALAWEAEHFGPGGCGWSRGMPLALNPNRTRRDSSRPSYQYHMNVQFRPLQVA